MCRTAALRASVRPGSLSLAFATTVALALAGGCTGGDRTPSGREAGVAASDTAAYTAALAVADTAGQIEALEALLARFPDSAYRGRAYRRIVSRMAARDPAAAAAFARGGLETEKQPEARALLHYTLFETVQDHAPGEEPAVIRGFLTDPAPMDHDIYNAIAWDLAERAARLDTALVLADIAVARAPEGGERAGCLDTRGWVHYHRGDHEQAIRDLEAARAANPEKSPEIEEHLAKAYQAGGRKAEARDLFVELLLEQENPDFKARVAAISRELGESAEPIFRRIDVQREEAARPSPDFALKNYAGEEVRLSDFAGQVVLLNFWHPT